MANLILNFPIKSVSVFGYPMPPNKDHVLPLPAKEAHVAAFRIELGKTEGKPAVDIRIEKA